MNALRKASKRTCVVKEALRLSVATLKRLIEKADVIGVVDNALLHFDTA